ncbi:TlpA family protein disulfide reductase [Ktedonobacteria bacterium brp13]|nr:TlpA family protein disulfide reductase [Ktedonobacteria bacterium brp13]
MKVTTVNNQGDAFEQGTVESSSPTLPKRSRRRNMVVFTIVTLINVGLIALLWTQLMTPKASTATSSPDNTMITSGDVSSPLIGKQAPDFSLPLIDGSGAQKGQKLNLAAYKGKPVIVNFWASWCDPCKEETPLLQQQWVNSLQAKGVVLIGIDGGEPSSDGTKFLQQYGVTYPNVADSVAIGGSAGDAFGITARPESYFIDRDGKVVARWIGGLTTNGLQQELAKLHVH